MKNALTSVIGTALFCAALPTLGQTVTVVPRVAVTETLTDNVTLTNVAPRSEQTTEISPGVRVTVNGARLKTYFDYSLSHIAYAQSTSANRNQNTLNTFGTLEAVDGRVFLDFSGNISRQAVSAFGTQSQSNTAVNANQAEVSTYRVSPYVRTRLGSVANLDARISRSVSASDNNATANSATTDTVVKLASAEASRSLGWTAQASRQRVDYSSGRPTESDLLSLGLTYTVTPQLKLFADAGRESSNYTGVDKQSYSTSNLGLNWRPSERTTVAASRGDRSFGGNHNLSIEHRTGRTVWKFSDGKDVLTTPGQNGFGVIGNVYDLFDRQFASTTPDAQARADRVDQFLQNNGINPNTPVLGNFLTSAVTLQRRQDLSFALLGVRDTITFLFSRSTSNRLDTVSSSIDSLSATNTITQQGLSVNYNHRLTPDYSLGVQLSQQTTAGDVATQDNTLRSLGLNVSGKVGKRTSTSLGLRRLVADSPTNPYSENALTGHLSVQF